MDLFGRMFSVKRPEGCLGDWGREETVKEVKAVNWGYIFVKWKVMCQALWYTVRIQRWPIHTVSELSLKWGSPRIINVSDRQWWVPGRTSITEKSPHQKMGMACLIYTCLAKGRVDLRDKGGVGTERYRRDHFEWERDLQESPCKMGWQLSSQPTFRALRGRLKIWGWT